MSKTETMSETAKELLERLQRERTKLEGYGYSFPTLFDAVQFLLEQLATDSQEPKP